MPRGDGSGPRGMGPMTGRGAGFCAGFAAPGYANPVNSGCGFGRGHGSRRRFCATGWPRGAHFGALGNRAFFPSDVDEKELLTRQAKMLEEKLAEVKKRLEDFAD
ncbi:MAG TPA: DUF5320 domain-containing protein [Firmicutes bacterium]|uniref:DUF5320 domain-containing protein n=1 Tax=Capillibacterium thermochitinicola TaxID=2699427 RepID=A0A8J6I0U0_9FIRM|nr:DUF5320 domain-containing protein [Capillibacterium thermochitinicola]MBA2133660.1 DUF5320 domain-containing protein [Capillibacterium thermochitinicola]HHW12652.1 DUF5320 domain-containing protein [Bacillota bacterium]